MPARTAPTTAMPSRRTETVRPPKLKVGCGRRPRGVRSPAEEDPRRPLVGRRAAVARALAVVVVRGRRRFAAGSGRPGSGAFDLEPLTGEEMAAGSATCVGSSCAPGSDADAWASPVPAAAARLRAPEALVRCGSREEPERAPVPAAWGWRGGLGRAGRTDRESGMPPWCCARRVCRHRTCGMSSAQRRAHTALDRRASAVPATPSSTLPGSGHDQPHPDTQKSALPEVDGLHAVN